MFKPGSLTQLQNATKNPNQAKKKTRPYILTGLKPGIERAFRLTGLTTGALHSVVTSNIVVGSPSGSEPWVWKGRSEARSEELWGRIWLGEEEVFVEEQGGSSGGLDN